MHVNETHLDLHEFPTSGTLEEDPGGGVSGRKLETASFCRCTFRLRGTRRQNRYPESNPVTVRKLLRSACTTTDSPRGNIRLRNVNTQICLTFSSSDSAHRFYHAAITEPHVRDLIVVEVSSPTAKKGSCSIIHLFLDQRSRKVVV